ncbi:unnamed protein product [Rangifer tarandus platyrhynchus]|uniref:Uncharacterized protein n=1 Tax=Rangifer tarandus platyrhynchus TaxID=3082113 RepID=A0ABN9A167_RANTA|nr:unnamed protein product [Rangifer tarandus platyrhynchus]
MSLARPPREAVSCTWYDHYYGSCDTYLAVLLSSPFYPGPWAAPTSWPVPVGTDDCGQTRDICSGRLRLGSRHRAPDQPLPVAAGIVAGVLALGVLLGLLCWRRVNGQRAQGLALQDSCPPPRVVLSAPPHPPPAPRPWLEPRAVRPRPLAPGQDSAHQALRLPPPRRTHRPIPVHSFQQSFEAKSAHAYQAFFQEFEVRPLPGPGSGGPPSGVGGDVGLSRPQSLQELKEVGKEQLRLEAANSAKNRYPHVLPCERGSGRAGLRLARSGLLCPLPTHTLPSADDHSRVRLALLDGKPHSDYINASFIPVGLPAGWLWRPLRLQGYPALAVDEDCQLVCLCVPRWACRGRGGAAWTPPFKGAGGYTHPQEFIATQGPLKKTLVDFWRLVWEQQVRVIVMLTVGMENGRVLCEHYWPADSRPITHGPVTIRLLAEQPQDEWTTREFQLHHFTTWPDHSVPEAPSSLLAFVELVQEQARATVGAGPLLVHCSAGVGRSGTFVVLWRLLRQLEEEQVVDVFHAVHVLRLHRPLMIQTPEQYVHLYSCLDSALSEGLP